jgi:hypothetical protein
MEADSSLSFARIFTRIFMRILGAIHAPLQRQSGPRLEISAHRPGLPALCTKVRLRETVVLRKWMASSVVMFVIVAIACPETATADPAGAPCCDAVWCINQEALCTAQCAKYKRGSEKWKECNQYCSKTLSRCTKCCQKHREPHCNVYCFE